MTMGLDTTLYLMLCRFLNRDYETVFRLADSIATDTKFSAEGTNFFGALKLANDDWHPDAHAIRLKTSLMTVDSGVKAPWDITIQLARHSVKLDRVSANCRLTDEEELQLLNTEHVVTSEKSENFNFEIHDHYSMALVSNRKVALDAIVSTENATCSSGGEPIVVSCMVPPRAETKAWPYYMDNTALGEQYASVHEVTTKEQWKTCLSAGDEPPPGGWLVMVMFHVLWDKDCVKVMESMQELAPAFPAVKFVSVRGDNHELQAIAQDGEMDEKGYNIQEFPTMILMRGGEELSRIEGRMRL